MAENPDIENEVLDLIKQMEIESENDSRTMMQNFATMHETSKRINLEE